MPMKVILSQLAAKKMKYYIDCIGYEISGIGLVEKRENGTLYVPDIFLLKQEVTGAETDLDSTAVGEFINEKLQDPDFPVENLKLWWHSHVNMAVFWSGTDNATINRLDTDQAEENWWLSIVGNKRDERRARIDVYQPHRMWMDELQIEYEEEEEDPLKEQIKEEIKEKVTVRTLSNFPKTLAGNVIKNKSVTSVAGEEEDIEEGVYKTSGGIYLPKKDVKYRKGQSRKI